MGLSRGRLAESRRSDLGSSWAPKVAKDGTSRGFWRALERRSCGEDCAALNADSHIRVVSTVTEVAVDDDKSSCTGQEPARRRRLGRQGPPPSERNEAISLASILIQPRISKQDPFTKDGSVRHGYFSALSDRFADQLSWPLSPTLAAWRRYGDVPGTSNRSPPGPSKRRSPQRGCALRLTQAPPVPRLNEECEGL